jgi:hypothetical protein
VSASQAVEAVKIVRRGWNTIADDLIKMLSAESSEQLGDLDLISLDEVELTASERDATAWAFGSETVTGGWEEVSSENGVTYRWPDATINTYNPFVTYRGTGDFAGITLALGYRKTNGEVIGFLLGGGGGSKRGLTVFFNADDYAQTNEKVSMIRGGGQTGRAGFGPGEVLPPAYHGFKTEVLGDRVAGKWNVQAVVAKEDDVQAMLSHTALQARLRGLA